MQKDFLQIDELRLDKECLAQPSLYLEYAEKLADAKRDYDELKSGMEVVEAELRQDIRERPARYGITSDKPTEGSINASVLMQPKQKAANKAVLDAKHKVDILTSAVVALEHKKRSLTLLVSLHAQGYFAEPRVTGAGKDAVNTQTKTQVRRLGQRKVEVEDDED